VKSISTNQKEKDFAQGAIKIPTSSTKIITGANRVANEKRALVSFSASPNHYLTKNKKREIQLGYQE